MFLNEPGGFVGGSTENERPITKGRSLYPRLMYSETHHGLVQRRDMDPGVMQVRGTRSR